MKDRMVRISLVAKTFCSIIFYTGEKRISPVSTLASAFGHPFHFHEDRIHKFNIQPKKYFDYCSVPSFESRSSLSLRRKPELTTGIGSVSFLKRSCETFLSGTKKPCRRSMNALPDWRL
jgi:hypothetical protein